MSEFNICVEITGAGQTVHEVWFDLEHYDTSGIYEDLRDGAVEPCEMEIAKCTGFRNYTPGSIEEACDLYQEYQRLKDPKLWPLFLEWYQDESINVLKSVRNFGVTFHGLHLAPGDYLAERAVEKGDIAMDFDGWDFMDWDAYAKSLQDKGHMAFLRDPLTTKVGVFDQTI